MLKGELGGLFLLLEELEPAEGGDVGHDRMASHFEQIAANEQTLPPLSILSSVYAPVAAPIGAFVSAYKL